MGFLDFFISEDRRIAKEQRNLTNRDKNTEDREAAARWLCDRDSPRAIVALLTRFDMNLENQLKDQAEKELTYSLIAAKGAATLRPLARHLERCRQLATPLRMFVDLFGEDAAVEKAFHLLQVEHERDDLNKPEKKVDLLIWLVEKRHPDAIERCALFLHDFDENVRYAAAEVMLGQQDDAARPLLEAALVNPTEESNRLRVRLCEAFEQRRWPLDDPEAAGARLAGSYAVRDNRIVRTG